MDGVLAPGGDSGRSIVGLHARGSMVVHPPLSSSSVPIVAPLMGPLMGPLLGDGASAAVQPAAPAPTSASGGSSGDSGGSASNSGGSSGSSGSGGSGGNGRGSNASGGGNSGNGGGSSGSGGGDGGSGGGSSGNGGGSTPTLAPSLASGGGTAVPLGFIPPGLASSTSISGNSGGTKAIPPGPSVSKSLTSTSRPSAPIHSGAGPSIATTATTPDALAASYSSPSQPSLASGTDSAGGGFPSSSSTTSPSPGKHQLSGGVIAGIAIVCFIFLLTLALVIVRYRSSARRAELWRQWSGHRGLGGRSFFRNIGRAQREDAEGRPSARSSFGTNFDQGLMFGVEFPSRQSPGIVAPNFPPMAEVRERNSVLISPGHSTVRRESVHSILSNDSDPDCQYVVVPELDNQEPSTPMSVRPFSPSESFAFPKPPAPKSSTATSFLSDTQGVISPRNSATLIHLSTPPRALMKDLPPPISIPPPFIQTSTSGGILSPSAAPVNPFLDPPTDPERTGFADVEVIRRPYNPSLDDELAVRPGDRIRILSIFDDGWVFIEKLASTKGGSHEQGLIPVDCLREVTQALPTFLTQKRVTVYESG